MPGILTVVEQRDGVVKRVSHEALAAARGLANELGCDAHALVIGPAGTDVSGLGEHGADKILALLDDEFQLYQGSRYGQVAAEQALSGGYDAVILGATSLGKDLGPRIAARLGCLEPGRAAGHRTGKYVHG